MKAEGTTWTKKSRVGLCAKVAKQVWEEADEETKEAVQTKIAVIIADKQKASSTSTHGPKQLYKYVLSRKLIVTTHRSNFKFSPVQSMNVPGIFTFSSRNWLQRQAGCLVLMGGPNPKKQGGEISACRFVILQWIL